MPHTTSGAKCGNLTRMTITSSSHSQDSRNAEWYGHHQSKRGNKVKKTILILIAVVLIFSTSVAMAETYKVNEHIFQELSTEQDIDDHNESVRYEMLQFVIGGVVLIVIYAIAVELIVEYANETSLTETIQD